MVDVGTAAAAMQRFGEDLANDLVVLGAARAAVGRGRQLMCRRHRDRRCSDLRGRGFCVRRTLRAVQQRRRSLLMRGLAIRGAKARRKSASLRLARAGKSLHGIQTCRLQIQTKVVVLPLPWS